MTERFICVLVSLFSVLGLVLAAIGLYGLLALQVARREREFGIRRARGATAAQLIQLVSRQGANVLARGVMVATAVIWAGGYVLQNHWTNMPASNALAWFIAVAVLGDCDSTDAGFHLKVAAGNSVRRIADFKGDLAAAIG